MATGDKKELRRHYSSARRALTPSFRREADEAITHFLHTWELYRASSAVAFYMSDGTEPALEALLQLDPAKRFFLPRYNTQKAGYEMVEVKDLNCDLVPGKFGLLEPRAELSCADGSVCAEMLYLVPAVACDETGTRLGRGGGYYDRLLAAAVKPAVAVIYSCQLAAEALPREALDRPVGWIVCEAGIRPTHYSTNLSIKETNS